ncbi:MAG TPA: alpha/beta hydrolase [Gemmatimonadaceae bacterium]|nr:alpha/beta hydrolase [Gemmatimonadaceae bacterium]
MSGATSRSPVLILPGLGDSGPEHWQSHWERRDPDCERVVQAEWDAPRIADWVARLDEAVARRDAPVVLAAHSSACALVAHWAADASPARLARVRGALLVAPTDPEGPHYPAGPVGFAPMPLRPLPFASVVVASDDDCYVAPERAREYAAAWGSRLVMLAGAGHINAASGHGPWPEGYALLSELRSADTPVPAR